ncbi:hypothetical protein NDS46_28855 [Paenibacillus thiaminolyticus]|nr:hypothetical protein [Paenibacillus thiaminolyticus]WCF08216.1 hypothetical protein NDS46_28855 [Paenibacillus thiaminolyticus]
MQPPLLSLEGHVADADRFVAVWQQSSQLGQTCCGNNSGRSIRITHHGDRSVPGREADAVRREHPQTLAIQAAEDAGQYWPRVRNL